MSRRHSEVVAEETAASAALGHELLDQLETLLLQSRTALSTQRETDDFAQVTRDLRSKSTWVVVDGGGGDEAQSLTWWQSPCCRPS
jgi:hypothetical protein